MVARPPTMLRGLRERLLGEDAGTHAPLQPRLWLAVEEVIHHNDVISCIIIRPRGDVAACDPHPGDARVVKHDAEEGQAPIARRRRDKAAEEQRAVSAEVADQRAGDKVPEGSAGCYPIRPINIGRGYAVLRSRSRAGSTTEGPRKLSWRLSL